MKRPLLLLAGAVALGCLVGEAAGRSAISTLLALAGALLALALRAPSGRPALMALGGAAVALGAAGAALERVSHEIVPLRLWVETHGEGHAPLLVEGRVLGDGEDRPDRLRFALAVERLTAAGRTEAHPGLLRVDVFGQAVRPEVRDGDRVRAWATLRRVTGYANPGGNPPDLRARHEGLAALAQVKSARLLTVVPEAGVTARARSWARRALARFVPPGPEESIVRAMVLGDRAGLDEPTAEAFRVSGTYHVLALSGAQVALVAGLVVALARRFGAGPAVQALLGGGVAALYAVFVGGDVPVVRASLMAVVLLGGRALDLDADLANLLGLAALVLLVHRPSNVTDVGFQLSFGATLGLVLLTPALTAGVPRLPFGIERAIAASLAAQAALLPLLALHFHRIAPGGLVLNLLAVPLSSAVLLAGLLVLACAGVASSLATLAGPIAWLAAHALLRSSEIGLVSPILDPRMPAPSALAWCVHAAALASLLRGRRGRGFVLLGIAAALVLLGPGPRGVDGRLHMTVLDVGQGDAIVVRSPGGRVLMVDAGAASEGRFDLGETVVAPYLWSLGVRRIEKMVVSHAHPDHVGGVPFLLRAFAVEEAWEGPAPSEERSYRRLDEALRTSGVSLRSVARGVSADWDGVRVRVTGPPAPKQRPREVRNDDSVVLALEYGSVRLLLTGDIEKGAEEALAPERALVLKVPHHGSRSSSAPGFVAAVSPRVAIVSAGRRNAFGHPHPEVVERFTKRGALLLRTDRDGAVTVSTDGNRVWVSTFGSGFSARIR
jgi:competence protein ComEC